MTSREAAFTPVIATTRLLKPSKESRSRRFRSAIERWCPRTPRPTRSAGLGHALHPRPGASTRSRGGGRLRRAPGASPRRGPWNAARNDQGSNGPRARLKMTRSCGTASGPDRNPWGCDVSKRFGAGNTGKGSPWRRATGTSVRRRKASKGWNPKHVSGVKIVARTSRSKPLRT